MRMMREAEGYNIVKIRPCGENVFVQIEKLVRMRREDRRAHGAGFPGL